MTQTFRDRRIIVKLLFLVTFSIISISCFSQENKARVDKVEKTYLGKFNMKNNVIYEINNVRICIKKKDFQKYLVEFHNRYKDLLLTSKGTMGYKFNEIAFKLIDSTLKAVNSKIEDDENLQLSQKPFDEIGLRCLVDFDVYIDSGNCAIFDENGRRQYKIIRKYESDGGAPFSIWIGRRYYLINKKKPFFEVTDIMS